MLVGVTTLLLSIPLLWLPLAILVWRRYFRGDQRLLNDPWNARAAFSVSDVGKRVTINGDTVFVDGVPRPVVWTLQRFVDKDKGSSSKPKKVTFRHNDLSRETIANVVEIPGAPVTLRDGSYFENPAAMADVRFESLNEFVGIDRDAPIRLVKAQHFIDRWKQGGSLQARHEIPEDAFFTGMLNDPLLNIIAISCPRFSSLQRAAARPQSPHHAMLGGHPDEVEGSDHFHLSRLAPLLEARARKHPTAEVAVFMDSTSLDPRLHPLYQQGLRAVPHIFSHRLTEVWFLSETPDGIDPSSIHRGWQTFYHAISCTMLKRKGKCIDFAHLTSLTNWSQAKKQCLVPRDPPYTVERFEELLSQSTFADPAHEPLAISLYESFLHQSLQGMQRLNCSHLGWGDLEAWRLAEILPLCDQLRCLDLSGNPLITDHGAASLAAELPERLCELNLKAPDRSLKLTCPEMHPRSRDSVLRFRRFYIGIMGQPTPPKLDRAHVARSQSNIDQVPRSLVYASSVSLRPQLEHDATMNAADMNAMLVRLSEESRRAASASQVSSTNAGRSPGEETIDVEIAGLTAEQASPRQASPSTPKSPRSPRSPALDRMHLAQVAMTPYESRRKAPAALERARERERNGRTTADEVPSRVQQIASTRAPTSPTMSLRLPSMVEGAAHTERPAPVRHFTPQRSPRSGGSRQELSTRLSPRQQQPSPRMSPRHQVSPRAPTQRAAAPQASELDELGDDDTRTLRSFASAASGSPRSSPRGGTPGSRVRRQSPPREPAAPPFLASKSSPAAIGGVNIGGIRVGGLARARTVDDVQSQARRSSCDALWQTASAAPSPPGRVQEEDSDSVTLSSSEPSEPDLLGSGGSQDRWRV